MGKIQKEGDITVRMVNEHQTVLVPKSQVGKFISDRLNEGWQVQGTQDVGSGYVGKKKEDEAEVEVRLTKAHNLGTPAVTE